MLLEKMFYERLYHKVEEGCIPNNIHVTLALLAHAALVVMKAQARAQEKKGESLVSGSN